MIDVTAIRQRYLALSPHLDERARRIFAATEAHTAGYGGIAAVSRATGIAASTIGRGLAELAVAAPLVPERVRRPGGGDKKLVHRFHEADPRRGIPSVTGRLVGSRGVNVVAGHHGSTSSRGGIVDRLG